MESSLWVSCTQFFVSLLYTDTGDCGKVTYLCTIELEAGAKSGNCFKGNWEPFEGATQWKRALSKINVVSSDLWQVTQTTLLKCTWMTI